MQPVAGADSLFEVGRNCCAVVRAERAALLVDGADYFEAFMAAAAQAERSIIILAWDFDSRTPLSFGQDQTEPVRLGPFLNGLVKKRKKLHVHVLDWDYPMVFGHNREFPPIYGFGWSPRRRIHLRYDNTHPLAGSHHQKIVVIDDRIAFVGGLDLTDKRWDTPEHAPNDPRRRCVQGKPYPPFHDIMLAVDGPAARTLADIARERWRRGTGEQLAPVEVAADPWPDMLVPHFTGVDIGIACTVPAVNGDPGKRDVETLFLDMIRAAKRSIYIENQYFTANRIGEALAVRLAEDDGPEIVVISRCLSHGWLEEMTMHVLRTRLVKSLQEADRHGRFHIYYPHMPGLADGTCVDVHSKVMVIDDAWLRVGSSNVSNRSMGLDTECDAVIEAGGDERTREAIRGMRDRLIAEHLGIPPDQFSAAVQCAGSLSAAIAAIAALAALGAVGSDGRGLKELDAMPQWSDAVIQIAGVGDMEKPVSLDSLVEQFSLEVSEERSRFSWGKLALIALAVLGLTLLWRFTPLADIFTVQAAVEWAGHLDRYWWAPLIIMLAYSPASIVMFPRPLITLTAVVAYGPWLGFVYAMSGILLAALAAYYAGRLMKRGTVRRLAGRKLNRLSLALRSRGLLAVTAVRFIPVAPFAIESAVAGAIRIKLWHFMLGTFIGMLPGVLTATVFGNEITASLARGHVNWWLVALVLGVFVLVTLAVRRWFNRIESERKPHEAHPQQDALVRATAQ